MAQMTDYGGYKYVGLRVDGKRKAMKVHRLVLFAFRGIQTLQARHKNNQRDDNRLSNLHYGTSKDNHADRQGHGTAPVGVRNGRAKLTSAIVAEVRASTVQDTVLAAKHRVSPSTIGRIKHNEIWVDPAAQPQPKRPRRTGR